MINAETLECTVRATKNQLTQNISCLSGSTGGPSVWEVASAIANWGILLVALGALLVSYRSMRSTRTQGNKAMEIAYGSAQAQLELSKMSSEADLADRKNSRELDLTAEYIGALDELFFSNLRKVGESGRKEGIRSSTFRVLSSAGRYQMFIGDEPVLQGLQEEFIRALEHFNPTSPADLEGVQYGRLLDIHAFLRSLVFEFQGERKVRPLYSDALAVLKHCRLRQSWDGFDSFIESLKTL